MRIQQFLQHYGIAENPFGQEDAQSDHVFREHCLNATHHSAWDKIFGKPDNPSTAIIFGEKGSGKTALRLQISEEIKRYNQNHSDKRVFILNYDDFNPFLDSFRDRLRFGRRKQERALSYWRLWDHMDAILALATRKLVRGILSDGQEGMPLTSSQISQLTHLQRRDVLLLAALYDHQSEQPAAQRWKRLRDRLSYSTFRGEKERIIGITGSLILITLLMIFGKTWSVFIEWWAILLFVAMWSFWLIRQASLSATAMKISQQIRVFKHQPNTLRQILSKIPAEELQGQPVPSKDHSEDRYELLIKLQGILKTFDYRSIVVLVDRVDEPHLINGSPERMRDLLWPMFDNKFLKHPNMSFKMLLPEEVVYFLKREKKDFYDRSRLDKQNLIHALEWSGQSLYDLANSRLAACVDPNNPSAKPPRLKDFFADDVTEQELVSIFSRMRVPRHLFKFLYRLLLDHCERYTESNPNWKISRETLQTVLAVYLRDLDAFDRGMGTG